MVRAEVKPTCLDLNLTRGDCSVLPESKVEEFSWHMHLAVHHCCLPLATNLPLTFEVLTFHSLLSDRGRCCLPLSVLAVLEKEWSSIFAEGN